MVERKSLARRIAYRALATLALAFGVFAVVRAVVEIVTVDPHRPAEYRDDWGGPHYAGVLLVHAGPGLLVIILAIVYVRHRFGKRRKDPRIHQ